MVSLGSRYERCKDGITNGGGGSTPDDGGDEQGSCTSQESLDPEISKAKQSIMLTKMLLETSITLPSSTSPLYDEQLMGNKSRKDKKHRGRKNKTKKTTMAPIDENSVDDAAMTNMEQNKDGTTVPITTSCIGSPTWFEDGLTQLFCGVVETVRNENEVFARSSEAC
jgi:hypothetical protein